MDIRVKIAQDIEAINKQREMIVRVVRNQPAGLSRQQKRSFTIGYNGKNIKILEYFYKLGPTLPAMRDMSAGTIGVPVDHRARLQHHYMMWGADGIDTYLKDCVKVLGDKLNALIKENNELIAIQNGQVETQA